MTNASVNSTWRVARNCGRPARAARANAKTRAEKRAENRVPQMAPRTTSPAAMKHDATTRSERAVPPPVLAGPHLPLRHADAKDISLRGVTCILVIPHGEQTNLPIPCEQTQNAASCL